MTKHSLNGLHNDSEYPEEEKTASLTGGGSKNERFLSGGFWTSPGPGTNVESSSVTKKSLNGLHTHSGYSEEKKTAAVLNDLAFVGTRIRSFSMIGLCAVVPP